MVFSLYDLLLRLFGCVTENMENGFLATGMIYFWIYSDTRQYGLRFLGGLVRDLVRKFFASKQIRFFKSYI